MKLSVAGGAEPKGGVGRGLDRGQCRGAPWRARPRATAVSVKGSTEGAGGQQQRPRAPASILRESEQRDCAVFSLRACRFRTEYETVRVQRAPTFKPG
eukprot:182097-Chlamydomonas_euryale.AAC.3